ncbi:MAG TPA: hypothetical protein VII49_14505 [Rhizomicrobium sp.]
MLNTIRSIHLAAVTAALALAPCTARAADLGAEVANARMHAGLAAQGSSIAAVHSHLHHTINCLVGPNGTGFDAKELNPCASDGNGAIPDETDAAKKKALEEADNKAAAGLASSDLAPAQQDASAVVTMLANVK